MHHRRRIKEFRDKRGVLNVLLEGAIDENECAELQQRIDGMDDVIKRCAKGNGGRKYLICGTVPFVSETW